MTEYGVFADFYDDFMGNAEYEKRAEYVRAIFKKFDKLPSLLLDLACGTGTFTKLFKNAQTDVIGVDPSIEMLNIARQKSPDTLFLNQSGEELDLFGTVDGAVCCLDSLNHLENLEALKAAIAKVSLFLEPERLFIFDVNSVYKHQNILGNNTFVIDGEDVYCVWQNELCEDGKTVEMTLDFFASDEEGLYERSSEYITERAYTPLELDAAITAAGLKTVAVFGDMSLEAPTDTEERIIYVTRKV